MPIGEEESMMKTIGNGGGITVDTDGILYSNTYDPDVEQSYHQNHAQNNKRKFSVEENMFAINKRNGLHSQKSRYIEF